MSNLLKMSKYYYSTYDHEGNLVLYNFLTGIHSLAKVMKADVSEFERMFPADNRVSDSAFADNADLVNKLIKLGYLVDEDIDETIFYNAQRNEDAFNSELVVTILPTGKCNFKCPYCFEDAKSFCREAMTLDAQNALIKFVQKNISKHKSLKVAWFGGEPLLEADTIKYLSERFIQICNARFIPYAAEITTNGYFLDANMFDMLYKMKVYSYQITLDGSKERHDKYRIKHNGGGTFDTIMSNLLHIKAEKKYKFAHIKIRVNVLQDFFEELDEFVNYIIALFGDDSRFQIVFMPVNDYSSSGDFQFSNKKVTGGQLFSRLIDNDNYRATIYKEDEARMNMLLPKKKCVATRKNAYVVTPELSVYKCSVYYDHPSNRIGRINYDGDLEIDETIHRKWYALNKLHSGCTECTYLPICNYDPCPVTKYLVRRPINCLERDPEFQNKLRENILFAIRNYPYALLTIHSNKEVQK